MKISARSKCCNYQTTWCNNILLHDITAVSLHNFALDNAKPIVWSFMRFTPKSIIFSIVVRPWQSLKVRIVFEWDSRSLQTREEWLCVRKLGSAYSCNSTWRIDKTFEKLVSFIKLHLLKCPKSIKKYFAMSISSSRYLT